MARNARQAGRSRVQGIVRPAGLDATTLLFARFNEHHFPPHVHDHYVIGFNERGSETFLCRNRQWRAEALALQLINPGEVHTGETIGSGPRIYRAVHLAANSVQEAFGGQDVGAEAITRFIRPVAEDGDLALQLRRAHRRLSSEPLSTSARDELWATIGEVFARHARPESCDSSPTMRGEVSATRDYIRLQYGAPLSLEDLARRVGLSRHHLLRLFRRELGLTPYQYLLQVRVAKAMEMLEGGMAIVDAALTSGFCHQSHLTEHFRRLVGVTPGCYARGVREPRRGW